ncbi:MAG: c-type cytochrome [Rhodocyclaceae bacterium]|nr:c-type cytochrome [Rhodocyclaceae bacterium]
MLSYACAGCHGNDGSSVGPSMPSLAGQQKDAFVIAMKEFKSGERPSTVMGRLAKGYTDPEIEAMAGFFAKQKRFLTGQNIQAEKVTRGAALAEKNCSKCHTEEGRTAKEEAGTPILAGQWLKYLQFQSEDYKSGGRKMTKNMGNRVKLLSAEEMDDVAHFYASVK